MTDWKTPDSDGTQYSVHESAGEYDCAGSVWYSAGMYCWRVYWSGYSVKDGTGCVDRAEARREAEHVIAEIKAGRVTPPWKASAERQALEDRILRARAGAITPLPKYQP